MSLDPASYFKHLKAYLSSDYVVDYGSTGTVTLLENYYREGSTRKHTREVTFSFEGQAFAIKLDGQKDRLFHFLDDNGREWSKRCDFVVFQSVRRAINVYLFEFKTKSIDQSSIINQLNAGTHWCACLRNVIRQYTGDDRKFRVKKFVFTEHDNPGAYLDPAGKYLARDPSIRHYNYDHLKDLTLDTLENESINTV